MKSYLFHVMITCNGILLTDKGPLCLLVYADTPADAKKKCVRTIEVLHITCTSLQIVVVNATIE